MSSERRPRRRCAVVVARRALLERPKSSRNWTPPAIRAVVDTLNDDMQWDAVTALGVDGIVTDDPERSGPGQQGVAAEQ